MNKAYFSSNIEINYIFYFLGQKRKKGRKCTFFLNQKTEEKKLNEYLMSKYANLHGETETFKECMQSN